MSTFGEECTKCAIGANSSLSVKTYKFCSLSLPYWMIPNGHQPSFKDDVDANKAEHDK